MRGSIQPRIRTPSWLVTNPRGIFPHIFLRGWPDKTVDWPTVASLSTWPHLGRLDFRTYAGKRQAKASQLDWDIRVDRTLIRSPEPCITVRPPDEALPLFLSTNSSDLMQAACPASGFGCFWIQNRGGKWWLLEYPQENNPEVNKKLLRPQHSFSDAFW